MMARIKLEGMEELIDRVNKLGAKGNSIKKNALESSGNLVKNGMEKNAPKSKKNKKHMADNIQMSDIEKQDGLDFIEIGPNKGDNSEYFYSKFTEWGTTKISPKHWAQNSIIENEKEKWE